MTYSKQTWYNGIDGGTPITASRLNHMEDGIEAASTGGGGGTGLLSRDDSGPGESLALWYEAYGNGISIPSGGGDHYIPFDDGEDYWDDPSPASPYAEIGGDNWGTNTSVEITQVGLYHVGWELDWAVSTGTGTRITGLYADYPGWENSVGLGMYGYISRNILPVAALAYEKWTYGSGIIRVGKLPVYLGLIAWQDSGSAISINYADLIISKLL